MVHGDRDELFPVEIPVAMCRGIPSPAQSIIPSGGHVPIDDPTVPFAARALGFVGRAEADGAGAR